jgi:hypothetical protein
MSEWPTTHPERHKVPCSGRSMSCVTRHVANNRSWQFPVDSLESFISSSRVRLCIASCGGTKLGLDGRSRRVTTRTSTRPWD